MLNLVENIILFLIICCSINVLIVRNPVQSLLWLILTFALSSMLFMIFGVELMSIFIFMVYIGAIAVLFLFVIMILNIKIIELRFFYLKYLPIGLIIIFFFVLEILLTILFEINFSFYKNYDYIDWFIIYNFKNNLFLIGSIIFDYNFFIFFLLSIVLIIAMIGSIILLVDWDHKEYKILKIYSDIYFYIRKLVLFL